MYRPLSIGVALALMLTFSTVSADVNVYSFRQPFLVKPLFGAFTQQTGIPVNVVFAKKGLLERLRREGRNSPADLVLTVDIGRLNDLVASNLVQPFNSKSVNAHIPPQYRHPDGLWTGLTTRARIIVTSKDRIKPGEIRDYQDLADPKWRGRICTRSGKHPYMVALTAARIAHEGVQSARHWLTGLKANLARKPQGNDRAQVRAIKEGVCDIAVINHYYMGKMLTDNKQAAWAESVDVVFPGQNGRGTHVNVSGAAVTRHAPNAAHALKLLEFLTDDQAQRIYAEVNTEYPIKRGVPWSKLLAAWGPYKADDLSLAKVADYRRAAIKMADEVGYDQ